MPGSIRQELRQAWNRKLYLWWAHYNGAYLKGALRPPQIRLSQDTRHLGSWQGERRTLSISCCHIERDPWSAVLETLRHEMAHQYAEEVLGEAWPPHGPAFRQAQDRLRCPRPRPEEAGGTPHEERLKRRLQKILSLTESPNRHEAASALRKARELLARYRTDLEEEDRVRRYQHRRLGPLKRRHAAWELWLAAILNDFFFVQTLWAESYEARQDRTGTVLEIYGTRVHLEMAEYVYHYLGQLLEPLWQGYRRRRRLAGNRQRQRYFAGVVEGFHTKLAQSEKRSPAPRALVRRDAGLEQFFRWINPRVRTCRWGASRRNGVYRDGLRAGSRLGLRRPLPEAPSNRGRRLTSGTGDSKVEG